MNHLSPAEFVDAADGALPARRQAHLQRCPRCASRAAAMRSAIDAARESALPEPSPLYWSRMAGRIRDRVAGETIVPAWRASWRESFSIRGLVPIASAVAVVAAVFVSGLVMRPGRVPMSASTAVIGGTGNTDPGADPGDSEAWNVLTAAAAETPIEDAHAAGMAVGAGAVDRAVQRMSPDELQELERLLRSELKRSGD